MEKKGTQDLFTLVIAGKPNVGKSTLFNILTKSRHAVEHKTPGTTRDPVEMVMLFENWYIKIIDTGGFEFKSKDPLFSKVKEKAFEYLHEADLILFLVDANLVLEEDLQYFRYIQKMNKNMIVCINKTEGNKKYAMDKSVYSFNADKTILMSTAHKLGLDELYDLIAEEIKKTGKQTVSVDKKKYTFSIIGKPNVGKSTLLNVFTGLDKAIVSDIPGTTRDAVPYSISYRNILFEVIDTAGIRKKKQITEDLEYFSIKRSFKAIDNSDIVIHLTDSMELITQQDKKISDYIVKKARGYILAVNKIDKIAQFSEKTCEETIRYQFPHISFVKIIFISALKNYRCSDILDYIFNLAERMYCNYKTSELNTVLDDIKTTKPLLIGTSYLNLFYIVKVHSNPLIFKIWVNKDPSSIPQYYTNYLINSFRKVLDLESIPFMIKYEKRK